MKIEISAEVIEEAGYKSAMFGLSLNKEQPPEKMGPVAEKLAPHDYGHNKVLEHIMIWLNVRAPRYIWQEMDTFRLSSKNSQSTMHTIMKNELVPGNFECEEITEEELINLNEILASKNLVRLKRRLPEGFMQRRMWMMSYKTFRNIILQRRTHKLPHWQKFLADVLKGVKNPELLPEISYIHNTGDEVATS